MAWLGNFSSDQNKGRCWVVANPPAIIKSEHDVQAWLVPAVRVGLFFEESCSDALESTIGWVVVIQDLFPILFTDMKWRFDIAGTPLLPVGVTHA